LIAQKADESGKDMKIKPISKVIGMLIIAGAIGWTVGMLSKVPAEPETRPQVKAAPIHSIPIQEPTPVQAEPEPSDPGLSAVLRAGKK
jgi:hypothetical protein